ncbi:MAG TPA: SBBP repeat-containing protein [Thermoanaerobaculia bacterium]|nr:SBBP repeat-containing protein [Thermoanaerobaculia bacterium]
MGALAKTAQWLGRVSAITLIYGVALQAQTASFVYSTYLGGRGVDEGRAVAAAPGGGTCVTGITNSPDFPAFLAAQPDLQPEHYSGRQFPDAFVTCFGPTGELVHSTYLGDSEIEFPHAIAVGPASTAYVTGYTDVFFEGFFPFLARVRPFEISFLSIPGGIRSKGWDVAVDSAGDVYVTGQSHYDHPIGFYVPQAYVAKLGSDGSFLYVTDLEGLSGDEQGNAIAVDAAGNAYVAGYTTSSDFPATGVIGSLEGHTNAFVTKLDPSGAVVYSLVIGGSGSEEAEHLAADPAGNVFVAGWTSSADFPLLNPIQGAKGLFLARFDPDGALVASTYLGGIGAQEVTSLALDGLGRLYLAGTSSSGSPLSVPGCQGRFLAELDPESFEVLQATCLPGADVRDMAADAQGHLHLTGVTSGGLPTTVNAFQPVFGGGFNDAFVAKLAFNAPPGCAAAFASPSTIWPPNGKLVPITISGVTDPDGDPITLTVTGVRQDEPLSQAGTPDATGIGTPSVSLRADRAGKGDGRVYHLSFEARDPLGASCTGTVTVCVAHDRGRGRTCGDGGPLFNSSGG